MRGPAPEQDRHRRRAGAWTGVDGTGFPVDISGDRRARPLLALLVGGPVVWISHFLLVYLVAEAACTGAGPGLDAFDPPVLGVLTLVATAGAAAACGAIAYRAFRGWRRPHPHDDAGSEESVRRSLAFAGILLAVLSMLAVVAVGLPVLVFPTC